MTGPLEGIIPEIFVHDGQAALDFYAKAFGATVASWNMDGPKLHHGELWIRGHRLYVCEEAPASAGGICQSPRTLGGSPVRLMIEVDDCAAFVEMASAAGATIVTPMHASTWGSYYARLRDPFGHEWGINQQVD